VSSLPPGTQINLSLPNRRLKTKGFETASFTKNYIPAEFTAGNFSVKQQDWIVTKTEGKEYGIL
jgi:hypothetical protein